MTAPEELFSLHVRAAKLPEPVREYKFLSDRKFRADFAWIEQKLIVEIDGGTWRVGGHSSGAGIRRDYERDVLAMLAGWRVLRFTTCQVKSGFAIDSVERMLKIVEKKLKKVLTTILDRI
jgi:very-short-patch-repair endonuclease